MRIGRISRSGIGGFGAQGLVGLSPQGLVGLGAQRLVSFGRFSNLEVISVLLPYSKDCYVIRNTKVSGLKKTKDE